LSESGLIERPIDVVQSDQRFHLGGKRDRPLPFSHRPVQWFLTEPVPSHEQPARALVDDGEGEHANEPIDQRRSRLFVEMHEHFRVAVGTKLVPASLELLAQLHVVVDLTVGDHPDGAVFIRNRLRAALEVDDGQTAMSEYAPTVDDLDRFVAIRPAMRQNAGGARRPDAFALGKRPVDGKEAVNGAHKGSAWCWVLSAWSVPSAGCLVVPGAECLVVPGAEPQ
jgi:hypothetical protein